MKMRSLSTTVFVAAMSGALAFAGSALAQQSRTLNRRPDRNTAELGRYEILELALKTAHRCSCSTNNHNRISHRYTSARSQKRGGFGEG